MTQLTDEHYILVRNLTLLKLVAKILNEISADSIIADEDVAEILASVHQLNEKASRAVLEAATG